jgi:hypothetical protein
MSSDDAIRRFFRRHRGAAVGMYPVQSELDAVSETRDELIEFCYHVTPAHNAEGILERGLLRGAAAGRWTTARRDAGERIHVTFDMEEAAKWTGPKLLGKLQPEQEWAMFEIARAGINGRVFRDPASQTGYILEAPAVAKDALRVVRRWFVSMREGGT